MTANLSINTKWFEMSNRQSDQVLMEVEMIEEGIGGNGDIVKLPNGDRIIVDSDKVVRDD